MGLNICFFIDQPCLQGEETKAQTVSSNYFVPQFPYLKLSTIFRKLLWGLCQMNDPYEGLEYCLLHTRCSKI